MKQAKLLTFAMAFALLCATGKSQETKVPEPDFINIPAYYFPANPELMNFAKETPVMAAKMSGSSYELDGPASALRLKQSDAYEMIVKVGDSDPSTGLFLYKLEVSKKKRKAMMAKATMSGKIEPSKDQVEYDLKKVSEKIFRIIPKQPLAQGEFMFVWGLTAYTFGID